MNFRQIGYLVICGVALLYLAASNARGYIPFGGPLTRASGGGSGGRAFIFHK